MMANYGNNKKNSNKKPTVTGSATGNEYSSGPPVTYGNGLNGDIVALGATASTGIDPQFGSFGPPPPKHASNISGPRKIKSRVRKQQLPDHTEPWKQEGQVEQQQQQESLGQQQRQQQQHQQQGLNGDITALGVTSGLSGIEPMRPMGEGTFTPQRKRKARRPTDDYGTGPNNSRTQRKKPTVTTGLSSGYSDNW